jgi:hypothetical protein
MLIHLFQHLGFYGLISSRKSNHATTTLQRELDLVTQKFNDTRQAVEDITSKRAFKSAISWEVCGYLRAIRKSIHKSLTRLRKLQG